jgi:hypothetical protein
MKVGKTVRRVLRHTIEERWVNADAAGGYREGSRRSPGVSANVVRRSVVVDPRREKNGDGCHLIADRNMAGGYTRHCSETTASLSSTIWVILPEKDTEADHRAVFAERHFDESRARSPVVTGGSHRESCSDV